MVRIDETFTHNYIPKEFTITNLWILTSSLHRPHQSWCLLDSGHCVHLCGDHFHLCRWFALLRNESVYAPHDLVRNPACRECNYTLYETSCKDYCHYNSSRICYFTHIFCCCDAKQYLTSPPGHLNWFCQTAVDLDCHNFPALSANTVQGQSALNTAE